MAKHLILGKEGEDLAVAYLIKNNYTILERNYRYLKAEIDIIAKKNNVLAVVEVKTRSSNSFGNPQDFVKPKQIKNLVTAIDQYIETKDLNVDVRFDIIAIIKNEKQIKLEHIQDAFYHF